MWMPGIKPVNVPARIPSKRKIIIWISIYWKDLIINNYLCDYGY